MQQSNRKKRQRTGGLGSQEQFAKLGEIAQEGAEITPVAAENLQGYISSPGIVKGGGSHNENNVKIPQSSIQQLQGFVGSVGQVIESATKFKKQKEALAANADAATLEKAAADIAILETEWEDERRLTYKERTANAQNYITPERLNEITRVNPATGDEEINWGLLTNRESLMLHGGLDLHTLKNTSAEELNTLYGGLPTAWNAEAQRTAILDIWSKVKPHLQTQKGNATYHTNRSIIRNSSKETTASEARAGISQLISELSDDPNITVAEADEILEHHVAALYSNNPDLRENGVFRQVVEQQVQSTHNLITRAKTDEIKKYANELGTTGVIDTTIGQVFTHWNSGAIEIPEDANYTVESVPANVLSELVVDVLLGAQEDTADLQNPEMLAEIMTKLGVSDDNVGLDSVATVEHTYLMSVVHPIVAKRLAEVSHVKREVTNQTELRLNTTEISTPNTVLKGKTVAELITYPTMVDGGDVTAHSKSMEKRQQAFKDALIARSQAIATDPDISLTDKATNGLEVFSDEVMTAIVQGYHDNLGTYKNLSADERTKKIAGLVDNLQDAMKVTYLDSLTSYSEQQGLIRLKANLAQNAMQNTLSEHSNDQFNRSINNMDRYIDGVVEADHRSIDFRRSGNSDLTYKTNYLHPLNSTAQALTDLGVPEKLQDSFYGLIQKTTTDQNGKEHHSFTAVDPASKTGVAVTKVLEEVRGVYVNRKAGTLDKNANRPTKNDQDNVVDDIIDAHVAINNAKAPPPGEVSSDHTVKQAEQIAEARSDKWTAISSLVLNLNDTNEYSEVMINTLIQTMDDPELFYDMMLHMYVTDNEGNYHIHDGTRDSIIAQLLSSSDLKRKELGYVLEYLDDTLTVSTGSLSSDPDEKLDNMLAEGSLFDFSSDTAVMIDNGRKHAKKQLKADALKLPEQVIKAFRDEETVLGVDTLFDLVYSQLGQGGHLGPPNNAPETFDDARDRLLEQESTIPFLEELVIDYVTEYQAEGIVNEDGERDDMSLADWVTTKLNRMMTKGGWSTFRRDDGYTYMVKDPNKFLTNTEEDYTPHFKSIILSHSQPIIDIPDHANLQMTYLELPGVGEVSQHPALDSITEAIAASHISYLINDDTFLSETGGKFMGNNNVWFASPEVVNFYNVVKELKIAGEYPNRTSNIMYENAALTLIKAISDGSVKIPGTMDSEGNWESHPVYDTPSMIQADTRNFTFRDAVHHWVNITGEFPSQKVYAQIGNELQTKADITMYAIDSKRGSLTLPSQHARFTRLTADRMSVVPWTHLSAAELSVYANEPVFRDKNPNEPVLEYDRAKEQWRQTILREFQNNRNGYPVNLRVSDPSGQNPQALDTMYQRRITVENGRMVLRPTNKPVFFVNRNTDTLRNQLTRKQLMDNPGKEWTINMVSPKPTNTQHKSISNFIAPRTMDFVFPPDIHRIERGTETFHADDLGISYTYGDNKKMTGAGRHADTVTVTWDWRPQGDEDNPIVTVKTVWGVYRYHPAISASTMNLLETDVN